MDISKNTIDVICSCKKKIKVTLKQVANQESIKCNCGDTIKLLDKNGATKKGINDVKKSFEQLQKTLRNFGK
jgi:ASC-1-like (ASCH) protein